MLELGTITTIIGAIAWLHSFGKEDLSRVQQETEELLRDLSRSLLNLYDLTSNVSRLARDAGTLPDDDFRREFRGVLDYADRFYFDDEAIRGARTRCREVARDVERIRFKLATLLRSDLGKWKEADRYFDSIVYDDNRLLWEYQENVKRLQAELTSIAGLIDAGDAAEARTRYVALGEALRQDLARLRAGVDQMEATLDQVRAAVD